jgi:FMN phosphatase YigB (HAD superfamily)
VSDDESKEGKIRIILKETGLKPSEVMMVGDRLDSDINPARNQGLVTARLMKRPYSKERGIADYELKALKELIIILKEN